MSKGRSQTSVTGHKSQDTNLQSTRGIRASVKKPLLPAAIGIASMVLGSGASAQDAPLPTIDVLGTGGYQTTSPGLTRLPTPLRDTAQTVNVVPQEVIQEQNVSTVREALRNVAGVTFRAGEGGNQGDTPYIRGFTAQNDIFRDGIRDPGWYTRDAFPVEAVEVYKGPSSVLFGRGSTGGVINLITKTPLDRTFVDGAVTGNTGPGIRATVDANAQINSNVAARVQVMGQLYDIPGRDHVEENRAGIAPSLSMKVTDRTKVTLSYIYQHDDSIPDYGFPFLSAAWGTPRNPAPVQRGTWYGILSGPYKDTEKVDVHIGTAKIEHEFNNNVKVTNATRYTNVDRLQRNVFPEPNANVPPPPTLNANWTPNRAQVFATNTLLANQTDMLARFDTGFARHTMTAGLDLIRETRDFLRNNFTGMGSTNFLNPNPWRPGGTPLAPTASQLTYGESNNIGAYVADQIKITKWFEILGNVRFDQFRFQQEAPLAAASVRNLEHTDNLVSWRAGAVFHPTEWSSLYVMHGTSFNPTADNLSISVATPAAALNQITLGPEKNVTTEGGVKADVLGGRLSLAAAGFQTVKTNMRVPDPANNTFTVLAGEVEVVGAEASVTGRLTQQWQIIATYTHLFKAEITKTSVAAQLGKTPTNTPLDAFSLWTTYDITEKFQVGAGAFYTGEVWGDVTNTGLVPDFWRFDAMAAYKLNKEATLQFNIYNITDKVYYATAYSNWVVPGPSRTAALTLRVHFQPEKPVVPVKSAGIYK